MSAYRSPVSSEANWRAAARALAKRPGTLLDLGGGSPFQGYISRESLGPKTTYLCLDIFAEAKPHVVADTLELPLANSSIDAIFCNAMLEHVREPQRAVDEMYRVLAHSGRLILSVPFIYPYHDRVDYYRFTDTALRHIFRNFDAVEIEPLGDYFYVVWLFLTGFHFSVANRLDRWFGGLRSGLRGALDTLYDLVAWPSWAKLFGEHEQKPRRLVCLL